MSEAPKPARADGGDESGDDGGGGGGSDSPAGGAGGGGPRTGGAGGGGPPDGGAGGIGSRLRGLVSTWPRRIGVGAAALVGLLAVLYLAGVVGPPSAILVDEGDWGEVTDERTEIVTTIEVRNPNPLGASLGKNVVVEYDVAMNDVRVAEGSKSDIEIPPGTSTTYLRTDLLNEQLPAWWVGFVRSDETIHLNATAEITVSALFSTTHEVPVERTMLEDRTPVIDALSASVNSTRDSHARTVSASQIDESLLGGSGLDDGVLGGEGGDSGVTVGYEVERGWATWGEVTEEETTVVFHLRVHNPGDVPVPAAPDGIGVAIDTNDVRLFEAQRDELSARNLGTDAVIPPGETRIVNFTVTMNNDRVDEWFTSHVRSDRGPGQEATTVSSQFQVVFESPATGTTYRFPSDSAATYDCEFSTAILVDGRNASSTCGQPAAPVGE